MKRVVIYSRRRGVFLGSANGRPYWSDCDYLPFAPTFTTFEEAKRFVRRWDDAEHELKIEYLHVDGQAEFVDAMCCAAAGVDPNCMTNMMYAELQWRFRNLLTIH